MSSECSTSRHIFAPYCEGLGIDMGFGGSAVVPHALTMDLDRPYCPSFEGHKQILRGSCRDLNFLCDESMNWIASHHLLEDFSYLDLIEIIKEWRRVLKPGGLLLTNCPDQQRFLAHCASTGQSLNMAHYEQDFSLETFRERVLAFTGDWKEVFVEPNHGPYSWLLIVSKA